MKTIQKYELDINLLPQILMLPGNFSFCGVMYQAAPEKALIFVEVDTTVPAVSRDFRLIQANDEILDEDAICLGSVQTAALDIYHVLNVVL